MPNITIRERDLTNPGQLNSTSNAVYVPGLAKKLPKDFKEGVPRLYANLQDFQNDFGDNVPRIGGLLEGSPDTTEEYYKNAWEGGFCYDTGYIYATELLRIGIPVIYDCLLKIYEGRDKNGNKVNLDSPNLSYIEPKDDTDYMWEGITNNIINRFTKNNDLLLDKGLYNIKFISNGGYVTSSINNAIASFVGEEEKDKRKRSDCVALLDHPFKYSCNDILNKLINKDGEAIIEGVEDKDINQYHTMFTPWALYSPPCIQKYRKDDDTYYPNKVMLPASFGYLMAMASSINAGVNNWAAMAGASRGYIPYLVKLNEEITQATIDKLQSRDFRSINPIAQINPFGVIVWGNRTLFDNSKNKNLTASSFLNIRNLVSDVKKTIWTAARQLTFEQNSVLLWVKFKSLITPTLDQMVSGGGLSGYELIKNVTKEKAKLVATIRLYAIEAVEDFDITIELADDTTAITE